MTTGSTSYYSPNGLIVQTKTWTGSDGKTAENPYSVDMLNVAKKKCEYWSVAWGPEGEVARVRVPSADNCYYSSDLPLLALTGNQDLEALNKVADAIRGHSFNLAVFGAEARQTIDLIKNTCSQVLVTVKLITQGDWKSALTALRLTPGQQTIKKFRKKVEAGDFSGALLAIRYGWEPLLQDLYQLMLAVEGRSKNRGLVFRGAKRVTQTADVSSDPAHYPMPGQQSCTVKYKVILTEATTVVRNLGLLDPATVAWEKTPWSFVVDWFIPIGNYLSALGFFFGLDAVAVKVVFQETSVALQNTSVWKNNRPTGDDWLANMSFIGKRVVMVRTVGPVDVPKPNLKSLAKAFSLTHIENAAALIHQLVIGANPVKYAGRH